MCLKKNRKVCQFFEHGNNIPNLPSRTEFAVARKPP
jgi:hypothetical protein